MRPDITRYRVRCACGRASEGERQRRPQMVPCPACKRKLFIFPTGPIDPTLPSPPPRGGWRVPLLTAAIGLGVLVAAVLLVLPWLPRRGGAGAGSRDALLARIAAAHKQLGQGQFRVVDAELAELSKGNLAPLMPSDLRDLSQLRRQAGLLSRLSRFTVPEIVHQVKLAAGPAERKAEWEDHRGRGIIFDDVVQRDPSGRPVLADAVQAVDDEETVRLLVDDLAVLRDLPLEGGRRLLFGARLHSCEREEDGAWVIRFQPDSGVLLTDAAAAEAVSTRDLGPDLKELLARQKRWVDDHVR